MTTKRSSKTSPNNPVKVDEALVQDTSIAEVKKFSRWKTVEVILETLKDGNHQLIVVGDDRPYPFWTHAYQNLGINKSHSGRIFKRLTEEVHYVKLSNSELKEFYPTVHGACTVTYSSDFYYFLTEEGFNRVIIEIKTEGMKNREVAARIEAKKDEMAAVFTKFTHGELVPLFSKPHIDQLEEKKKTGTDLSNQVRKWVNKRLVPLYSARGENPRYAFSKEFTMINEIATGEHEKDTKDKLNSDGLDVHNATKFADTIYLKMGMTDDDMRKQSITEDIDAMYPDRFEKRLKLNERELALIKRGCNENQRGLFEFTPRKQLGDGA